VLRVRTAGSGKGSFAASEGCICVRLAGEQLARGRGLRRTEFGTNWLGSDPMPWWWRKPWVAGLAGVAPTQLWRCSPAKGPTVKGRLRRVQPRATIAGGVTGCAMLAVDEVMGFENSELCVQGRSQEAEPAEEQEMLRDGESCVRLAGGPAKGWSLTGCATTSRRS
jgi:hypothetical protein